MKNKIIFKTLMLKGEAGSTIVSMEKTGHVGTADIYTITFNDGSTTEISLENMSAITSVEKTSSTDTEDIYTITCADGSTQTFSVLNHNADIAAMSDDIDTIDARVDNFINSVVPNTVETLWTGSIKDVGDSATLSKAVSNFDYIDLYLLGSADSKYIRVPATQTTVQIQQQNLSDDASSNFLRLWEMGVSISGSTVSITKSIAWAWDDPDNSNPTVTANAQNGVPITRIDGVKVASDTPAEVTDIRVGADGTTYNSAGAAVRGQISDLKNALLDTSNVTFEQGTITQGKSGNRENHGRSAEFYKVTKGAPINFKSSTQLYRVAIYYYSEESETSFIEGSSEIDVAVNSSVSVYSSYDGYVKIRFAWIPLHTITAEDIAVMNTLVSISIPKVTENDIEKIENEISTMKSNKQVFSNVKTINHRGYETAPENTIPAFKLSKEKGFKYVETDVRFTSDGVAVLLHDASINRTARNSDGSQISETVNIADITYAQALTYDFGIYKGSEYTGTKIPTFEQFISLCRNIGLIPVIELKSGTEQQNQSLYDTVSRYGLNKKAMWLSQTYLLLTYIRDYADSAPLVRCTAEYNEEYTQYLKTTKNKVLVALPSTGINSTVVSSCIANDFELMQYTITTSAEIINADNYVSWFLSNALNAGTALYDDVMA